MSPDVTICIPAYQAEGFIERTLLCARSQTHSNIRIAVSIDRSTDRTEAICREQARLDSRIVVVAHGSGLGWAENCNHLLERVETPFFTTYFHDDIIEPTYVEVLLAALKARPDAVSAHCDVRSFGDGDNYFSGGAYEGSDCERLMTLLVGPVRADIPLRSLIRREVLARGLCYPPIGGSGFWRWQPFVMVLIAAGPSAHVPRPLYHRWLRAGSMTKGWDAWTLDKVIEGQRAAASIYLDVIDRAAGTDREKELVRFCLRLFMLIAIRTAEIHVGAERLVDAEAISSGLARDVVPDDLALLGPGLRRRLFKAMAELLFLESRHRFGGRSAASAKLYAAVALDPDLARAQLDLATTFEDGGEAIAMAIAHRAKVVDPTIGGASEFIARMALRIDRWAPRPAVGPAPPAPAGGEGEQLQEFRDAIREMIAARRRAIQSRTPSADPGAMALEFKLARMPVSFDRLGERIRDSTMAALAKLLTLDGRRGAAEDPDAERPHRLAAAISLNPCAAKAYIALSVWFGRNGRPALGLAIAERAVEVAPDDPRARELVRRWRHRPAGRAS